MTSDRLQKHCERYQLTDEDVTKMRVVLHILLQDVDPTYRCHGAVTHLAQQCGVSRPTTYHWADRVLRFLVPALRIAQQTGRPRNGQYERLLNDILNDIPE